MSRRWVPLLIVFVLLFAGCVQFEEPSEKEQKQTQAITQYKYFANKFNDAYNIWKEGRNKLNLALKWDNYYFSNLTKKDSIKYLANARDNLLQAKAYFELAEKKFKDLQTDAKTENQKQAVNLALEAIKLYIDACNEYEKCLQIEAQGKLFSNSYANCLESSLNKIEKADRIMFSNVSLLLQREYINAYTK